MQKMVDLEFFKFYFKVESYRTSQLVLALHANSCEKYTSAAATAAVKLKMHQKSTGRDRNGHS